MPGGAKMQRDANSVWFSCGLAVSTRFSCQGCGREAARCELVLFWLDSCRGPESSDSGLSDSSSTHQIINPHTKKHDHVHFKIFWGP